MKVGSPVRNGSTSTLTGSPGSDFCLETDVVGVAPGEDEVQKNEDPNRLLQRKERVLSRVHRVRDAPTRPRKGPCTWERSTSGNELGDTGVYLERNRYWVRKRDWDRRSIPTCLLVVRRTRAGYYLRPLFHLTLPSAGICHTPSFGYLAFRDPLR